VRPLAIANPQDVYNRLMAARRGDPVEETLARILASWSLGYGALPDWLGMDEDRFSSLLAHHFPGIAPLSLANPGRSPDPARLEEVAELRRLLLENCSGCNDPDSRLADIVSAACMGDNHLWEDLGLWCRADLSRLMQESFAPLAARNDRDMKWKKFLYKQLCETEGIYTCRSPSCEVCADYVNCFGPET